MLRVQANVDGQGVGTIFEAITRFMCKTLCSEDVKAIALYVFRLKELRAICWGRAWIKQYVVDGSLNTKVKCNIYWPDSNKG